ncbi:MAG: hypothetical protein KJ574_00380 [Nanoarchaeota archaeon]|nr:hypothetical protein [Nanoarchaeota archaeon]
MPYWEIAKLFFEKLDNDNALFFYSGFILKELEFILTKEEFDKKRSLFHSSPNFRRAHISTEELNKAREIEKELSYIISFYDIIHILLSKRTNSILMTRDKNLLEIAAKQGVVAKRPEEFL